MASAQQQQQLRPTGATGSPQGGMANGGNLQMQATYAPPGTQAGSGASPPQPQHQPQQQQQQQLETLDYMPGGFDTPSAVTLPTTVQKLEELVKFSDPNSVYQQGKKVGEGAAGSVYIGTERATGRSVAIKTMQLTVQNKPLIATEIQIMKTSKHANIVEFIDAYLVENKTLWVIMEFMANGSLTDVLEYFESGIQLSEAQMAFVARETLRGLTFVHASHRIHRDIKSDNILVGGDGSIKIGAL
jgi:serine/threonine protein kinase